MRTNVDIFNLKGWNLWNCGIPPVNDGEDIYRSRAKKGRVYVSFSQEVLLGDIMRCESFFIMTSSSSSSFLILVVLWLEFRSFCLLATFYCLNRASSPLCSGYFGGIVLYFVQAGLDLDPPILCF
jgi:hypothetical protein